MSVLAVFVGLRGLWIAVAAPTATTEGWDKRTAAQLRFLTGDSGGELEERADAMQRLFPEGRLFTLALTGLAWNHLADRGAVPRSEAEDAGSDILVLATDGPSRDPFGPAGGLPSGMFFEAWTAQVRLAAPRQDSAQRDSLAASCRRLDTALSGPELYPDSYPGSAWPADAVVGASALHQCGAVDPEYARTARQWLARVRGHLDPGTGLIPHDAIRPDARGSSSALMIPFLAEIDSSFARDQYEQFEVAFGTRLLGVAPTVREYPHGREGRGDVDSGPVVLGVSAPASVVGIAAARAVGDASEAEALRATVEAFGGPVSWRGQRSYALGRLPVGDAFLAWASSVPLAEPSLPTRPWRFRWVLSHLGLLALGGWSLRRSRVSRPDHRLA